MSQEVFFEDVTLMKDYKVAISEVMKVLLSEHRSYRKEFEEIFIQYFPKVRTFAAILLKSEQEAEDIAQDIFVKLWEQPDLWEGNLVRNYLYTMVKNHIFNRIKRKNIESKYINSRMNQHSLEEITEFKDPLNVIYVQELQLLLRLSLEQLPTSAGKYLR